MQQDKDTHEKASLTPPGDRDTAYPGGGTGPGTGGRYDEKRDPPFSAENAPAYVGHAASYFDASRHGAAPDASIPVTDSGVSNANVDEFTTGGNSLGKNAGASRDNAHKK